jgi:hypothetical protein
MRYALDEKPISYTTIGKWEDEEEIQELKNYNKKYNTNIPEPSSKTYSVNDKEKKYDWREIIY